MDGEVEDWDYWFGSGDRFPSGQKTGRGQQTSQKVHPPEGRFLDHERSIVQNSVWSLFKGHHNLIQTSDSRCYIKTDRWVEGIMWGYFRWPDPWANPGMLLFLIPSCWTLGRANSNSNSITLSYCTEATFKFRT